MTNDHNDTIESIAIEALDFMTSACNSNAFIGNHYPNLIDLSRRISGGELPTEDDRELLMHVLRSVLSTHGFVAARTKLETAKKQIAESN